MHDDDRELRWAQRKAWRSRDALWWCNLGAFYATRRPPDLKRARRWYAKAAAAGDAGAAYELGFMLLEGEGGEADLSEGRRLMISAAAAGELSALKVVAEAYETGRWGFRRSAAKAKQFAERAARASRK